MTMRSKKVKKIFKKANKIFENVKTGIESVFLIQFQHVFFLIETMGSGNMMGPSVNFQVKADGREKQKSGRKYKFA
jgi:hypothetical protein